MKASWSSDQSVSLILISPGCLSPIQPAITWSWIFTHWAPNSWTVRAALQQRRSFPRTPIVYTLTAPLKHLRLQSDILCQGWGLLGLLAVGHEMEEQWWCWGGRFWRLDAFTALSPPSNPDDKTYGLRYDVAGQCLIAKPHKSPRLLSQSRPVSVDQTVRTQPQIKIKGESGPCCIVPVFVLHISIESQSTLSTWTHIFLF